MAREINFLQDNIPDNVGNLLRIGAEAHRGKSGKYYKVDAEVFSWKDRFAAGVTRVNPDGTIIKAASNKGGVPEITKSNGQVLGVGHTYHTHEETEFTADGVAVRTMGIQPEELSDFEDDLMGLP